VLTIWVKTLPIVKKVIIENLMFNLAMQFKYVSNGFILNAYWKNKLHNMKMSQMSNNLGTYVLNWLTKWFRLIYGTFSSWKLLPDSRKCAYFVTMEVSSNV
jgi:hypothetical protein